MPLYYQLAQFIEHAINVGDLAPGDRIENELSLTSRLGLSRPTARQAIQELVNKGLLVRKRGVGTQVVRSQFRRDERLSSLNEDLAKAGKTPSTVLLDYQVGELEDEIRDVVDSADVLDSEFIKIRRLRLADNVPLAILSNYIPSRIRDHCRRPEIAGPLRVPQRLGCTPEDRPPADLGQADGGRRGRAAERAAPRRLPGSRPSGLRRRRPVRGVRAPHLSTRLLLHPVLAPRSDMFGPGFEGVVPLA